MNIFRRIRNQIAEEVAFYEEQIRLVPIGIVVVAVVSALIWPIVPALIFNFFS